MTDQVRSDPITLEMTFGRHLSLEEHLEWNEVTQALMDRWNTARERASVGFRAAVDRGMDDAALALRVYIASTETMDKNQQLAKRPDGLPVAMDVAEAILVLRRLEAKQ